jgi:hypothetical protein
MLEEEGFPLLIASGVYHAKWLEDHLPPNHSYFHTSFYTRKFADSLKPRILLGEESCEDTGMRATGWTAYVKLLYDTQKREERRDLREACLFKDMHSMFAAVATSQGIDITAMQFSFQSNADVTEPTIDQNSIQQVGFIYTLYRNYDFIYNILNVVCFTISKYHNARI